MIQIKKWTIGCVALLVAAITGQSEVVAAGSDSAFSMLSSDQAVGVGPTALITIPITVSNGTEKIFVEADGRYYPSGGAVAASVFVTVDGTKISNDSYIDWHNSTDPSQHSFNAIGTYTLGTGIHQISMMAAGTGGFTVGANSALSVLTKPATNAVQSSLSQDSSIVQQPTFSGYTSGYVPVASVLTASITSGGAPVFALGSGRIYYAGNNIGSPPDNTGDAMWGLSIDGPVTSTTCCCLSSDPAGQCSALGTWSDNDVWPGAELASPLFVQAVFPVAKKAHTVSLDAGVEPYGTAVDQVWYRVGAPSTVVLLSDGMTVYGGAPPQSPGGFGPIPYQCIANTQSPTDSACPQTAGAVVVVASATITIPTGHNGVVFFAGKTRIQGDPADVGGNAFLWITILDSLGNMVGSGSAGVQQLSYPNSDSTRTLSASYLSAGANALVAGHTYTVNLNASAQGSFKHLCVTQDLPLIWFD